MQILVTGATGFLGSHLLPFLSEHGHSVQRVTRSPSQAGDVIWNPPRGEIDVAAIHSPEAVIHLAGENIADGRWTDAKKQRIRESRLQGTKLLCATLASLHQRPRLLVSSSAIGYYGDRGDEILTEESSSGEGFLAEVCCQWETATHAASQSGIRTIHLRNGLVLAADGGALHKMLYAFRLGLGGPVGSGRQYWSWISITDWLHVILHCFVAKTLSGAVNATTPNPVRNTELTQRLGHALKRPTLLPVPEFALRLALGEMADEMLLASARVMPARLQASGYEFTHATLEKTFQAML